MRKYNKTKKLKTLENMVIYLMLRAKSKEDEELPLKDLYEYLDSMLSVIHK